jgi:hypothetical protein
MPPPGLRSSIAPISLHNAIRNRPKSLGSACGVALQTAVKAILTHYGFLKMPKSTVGALLRPLFGRFLSINSERSGFLLHGLLARAYKPHAPDLVEGSFSEVRIGRWPVAANA